MLAQDERIEKMHARACEIKKARERKINTALQVSSVLLFACLITVMSSLKGLYMPVEPGGNTGSSLLDSSAGGYVLVAVLAFALGVVLTLVLTRRNRK